MASRDNKPVLVYCKHMDTDIYQGTCAMCTPPEPEHPTGWVAVTMTAQFDTHCHACERGVRAGQDIALVDGEWIHAECADDGDG